MPVTGAATPAVSLPDFFFFVQLAAFASDFSLIRQAQMAALLLSLVGHALAIDIDDLASPEVGQTDCGLGCFLFFPLLSLLHFPCCCFHRIPVCLLNENQFLGLDSTWG